MSTLARRLLGFIRLCRRGRWLPPLGLEALAGLCRRGLSSGSKVGGRGFIR